MKITFVLKMHYVVFSPQTAVTVSGKDKMRIGKLTVIKLFNFVCKTAQNPRNCTNFSIICQCKCLILWIKHSLEQHHQHAWFNCLVILNHSCSLALTNKLKNIMSCMLILIWKKTCNCFKWLSHTRYKILFITPSPIKKTANMA